MDAISSTTPGLKQSRASCDDGSRSVWSVWYRIVCLFNLCRMVCRTVQLLFAQLPPSISWLAVGLTEPMYNLSTFTTLVRRVQCTRKVGPRAVASYCKPGICSLSLSLYNCWLPDIHRSRWWRTLRLVWVGRTRHIHWHRGYAMIRWRRLSCSSCSARRRWRGDFTTSRGGDITDVTVDAFLRVLLGRLYTYHNGNGRGGKRSSSSNSSDNE